MKAHLKTIQSLSSSSSSSSSSLKLGSEPGCGKLRFKLSVNDFTDSFSNGKLTY